MSPKPFSLDRALDSLREERPPPDATTRARAALNLRLTPRRGLARPLAGAMFAALVAALLVPRSDAGSAWAQTLLSTVQAPLVHFVSRWPDGRIEWESWRSGRKEARLMYRRSGELQMEDRSDGSRRIDYFDVRKRRADGRFDVPPGERRRAILSNVSKNAPNPLEFSVGDVRLLLNDPAFKIVEHGKGGEGRPETYRLRRTVHIEGMSREATQEFTAEVDPTTRRITALVWSDRREGVRTVIDYPASIPASVFAPRLQVAQGVEVYDLDLQIAEIRRDMRRGIARSGPVTLRALLLDDQGELWAYWTGAKTGHPFDAPGVRFRPGAALTSRGSLSGMARIAEGPLGERIDLDVPYPNGVARFRDVPVRRCGFASRLEAALALPVRP